MFCSSLRKRPEWIPAIPLLAGSTPRLQESRLSTHDIALPLPQQQQQGRFLRLVLLSPKDVGAAATEERLERLFNLDGGRDAAVIFLLDQEGRGTNPTEAFVTLQIKRVLDLFLRVFALLWLTTSLQSILNKLELPLIPLTSVGTLSTILANFQLVPAAAQPIDSSAQATSLSLLQHMSSGSDPLSEHAANLLSELGRSPREVSILAVTDQGRARILDLLGSVEGTRVLLFLAQEKPVFA
ncbi:hypothetical protein LZ32DRAFT_610530 [Colletotrichum eremochloae]|nr:hypothetical protein LZ32DRAFT_610530 [Colletotrichum eremochloae]